MEESAKISKHTNVCCESNHKYPKLDTASACTAPAPLVVWSLGRKLPLSCLEQPPVSQPWQRAAKGSRGAGMCSPLLWGPPSRKQEIVCLLPCTLSFLLRVHSPKRKPQFGSALRTTFMNHWSKNDKNPNNAREREKRERGKTKPNTISIVND